MSAAPETETGPGGAGLWSSARRPLTIGLVLAVTLVAFESLAIATVMPAVEDDLGDLALYGWVFSGFFLASLVGVVVAGQVADRRGPALPFGVALACFAVGLAIGGTAGSMPVLVLGRVVQGLGSGAVSSVAYTAIARGYPPALRPAMFAAASTAWVVPGMVGPAIAAAVEHPSSWRVVFLGLLPLVGVAAITVMPALSGLGPPEAEGSPVAGERDRTSASNGARLGTVLLLVAGVATTFLAAQQSGARAAVMVAGGVALATWAFVRLVPEGTLRFRSGVPAAIGVRGVLTCTFFSADAYISLAVTDGRGAAPWVAGTALSCGALAWAAGSWTQARLIATVGARRLVRMGFVGIVIGVALLITVALGAPVGVALLAWAFGGLGMGVAYAPLAVTVLAEARPGLEGEASASLQLADGLGIAIGTGLGGAVVAVADGRGWPVDDATAVVFGLSLVLALAGFLAATRLAGPTGPQPSAVT